MAYVHRNLSTETAGSQRFPDCPQAKHLAKHGVQIPEHVAGGDAGVHRIGEDAAKEAGSV